MTFPSVSPTLPAFVSRLPNVGTTIFTTMSALATQHGAVNLGQGFPDFACEPTLVDAVAQAMRDGKNQYPPMTGIAPLRHAISAKNHALYGRLYDPDLEVTVTAGATQAIMTAIFALVHPGDEVIVIEPVYDSYIPSIILAGGTPVPVQMAQDTTAAGRFYVPWDLVEKRVTAKTRLILVNSPHNPTGSTFHRDDLLALEDLVMRYGLLVLSDEVYEHMVYDGAIHESAARYPALAERTVVISSFGKTFHVTGWKIGYACAPAALSAEFRKVHQFNVFTVNTPMQFGIAAYLADPEPYLGLSAFYQAKRDRFRTGLADSAFEMLPCAGTYFQLVDYRHVTRRAGTDTEAAFCRWLTESVGVAAIPVSAFYTQSTESHLIRFCFAKQSATIDEALTRLAAL